MATDTNSAIYTFGRFYTTAENKRTYDAIINLSAEPGGQITFILGKLSTGKTTILQALAEECSSRGDLSVEILSCDAFKNNLLSAIRKGETHEFYNHFFIKTDLLLLDDCQFLTETISDVLIHLAKVYIASGKALVLVGDYLVDSLRIPNLQVLHLVRASQTTRKRILQERLNEKGLPLEDEILDRIAEQLEDPRRIIDFVSYLAARQICED